jgi:hypothetical protein
MPEADRRLRQVAQLRQLWRAFRDPQERLEDARLSGSIRASASQSAGVQESHVCYDHPTLRAAIRHWWTTGDYEAIARFAARLSPALLEDEPLVYIYIEEAKARLAAPPTPPVIPPEPPRTSER